MLDSIDEVGIASIAQSETSTWAIIKESAAGKQIATYQRLKAERSQVQIENENIGKNQIEGGVS
jgi:hypothetical protein